MRFAYVYITGKELMVDPTYKDCDSKKQFIERKLHEKVLRYFVHPETCYFESAIPFENEDKYVASRHVDDYYYAKDFKVLDGEIKEEYSKFVTEGALTSLEAVFGKCPTCGRSDETK